MIHPSNFDVAFHAVLFKCLSDVTSGSAWRGRRNEQYLTRKE